MGWTTIRDSLVGQLRAHGFVAVSRRVAEFKSPDEMMGQRAWLTSMVMDLTDREIAAGVHGVELESIREMERTVHRLGTEAFNAWLQEVA